MKLLPLAKHGVFWTIQGEGALIGSPMAFIRLAGCSVGCPQCDTDYRVFRRVSVEELVAEVQAVVPNGMPEPWVWITGGEPTDHDLLPLVSVLRAVNFRVAIATAGVRQLSQEIIALAQWISVSPHTKAPVQRFGHELKVVPGLNGISWADVAELERLHFPYRFIQPIWWQTVNGPEMDGAESRKSTQECIAYVQSHPGWRLGIQAHKYWDVA